MKSPFDNGSKKRLNNQNELFVKKTNPTFIKKNWLEN